MATFAVVVIGGLRRLSGRVASADAAAVVAGSVPPASCVNFAPAALFAVRRRRAMAGVRLVEEAGMGDWDSGGVANLAGKGEARALRAFAAAAVCAAWRSSERMAAAVRGVVEGMGEGWGRVVVEAGVLG